MYYIYVIQNLVNDKVYVGQTKNLRKRLYEHQRLLRTGTHPNLHLQASWNKHFSINFDFYLLDTLDTEDSVNVSEKSYIAYYRSLGLSYNILEGGHSGPLSEETKLKISLSNKGKPIKSGWKLSDETRAKMSASLRGHKRNVGHQVSEETRKKISEANKGRTRNLGCSPNEETREKLRVANTGHPVTEETRQKLREANLGKKHSEETKEKLSQMGKGRVFSEEHKKNLSEANKRRQVNKIVKTDIINPCTQDAQNDERI